MTHNQLTWMMKNCVRCVLFSRSNSHFLFFFLCSLQPTSRLSRTSSESMMSRQVERRCQVFLPFVFGSRALRYRYCILVESVLEQRRHSCESSQSRRWDSDQKAEIKWKHEPSNRRRFEPHENKDLRSVKSCESKQQQKGWISTRSIEHTPHVKRC